MKVSNKKGQALILASIFMLLVLASSSALIGWSSRTSSVSHFLDAKIIAKEIAKAGIEKALFCLNGNAEIADHCGDVYGADYVGEANINFGNGTFTVVATDIDSRTKQIESTGFYPNSLNPKTQTIIRTQIGISTDSVNFNFGAQVGEGGISMDNNAGIVGNVYSNGDILGSHGAYITNDVWSAGTSTTVSDIEIGGDVRADIIESCDVDGDAYFNTNINSEVDGNIYSPYPNPDYTNFPISSEQIEDWKSEAEAGGIIDGDFYQDGGDTVELGPKKIIGNLILENNSTLILKGGLYVTGIVNISSGASIRLDSSYGTKSGFIIADSFLYMQNNGVISGASENSFIMLLSLASGGGGHDSAIELKNNAAGAIFFAPNGLIYLHNGVHVTELVGSALHISNNAILEYDTGLVNTNFSAGPGGGWSIVKGTWQEIK